MSMEPTHPVERSAIAHGWVRSPQHDTDTTDAWEQPDGQLYAAKKGNVPRIITLTDWTPLD